MKKRVKQQSGHLVKMFRRARKNWPPFEPKKLRDFSDNFILTRLDSGMLRAQEEVRCAIELQGLPRMSTLKIDYVPKTGDDWSPHLTELYIRFQEWYNHMATRRKVRNCTMLWCAGYGMREIERSQRIRNGSGRRMALQGLKLYAVHHGFSRSIFSAQKRPKSTLRKERRPPIIHEKNVKHIYYLD